MLCGSHDHSDCRVDVSQRDKLGAIGVAKAQQEMKVKIYCAHHKLARQLNSSMICGNFYYMSQIQVAEAEKDQSIGMKQAERDSKVKVSALRAQAIAGENEAEMKGKWLPHSAWLPVAGPVGGLSFTIISII